MNKIEKLEQVLDALESSTSYYGGAEAYDAAIDTLKCLIAEQRAATTLTREDIKRVAAATSMLVCGGMLESETEQDAVLEELYSYLDAWFPESKEA